jgi:hypothetical protein
MTYLTVDPRFRSDRISAASAIVVRGDGATVPVGAEILPRDKS